MARPSKPASLLRRCGGGRRVQLEGAFASMFVRCLRDTSNGDSRIGVFGVLGGTAGGPRDGGRLCGLYTDVPIDSGLDDRDRLSYSYSMRSSGSPPAFGSSDSSAGVPSELGLGLAVVRIAINWRSTWGVTASPGLLSTSWMSIPSSSLVISSRALWFCENVRRMSTSASPGITGSSSSFVVELGWLRNRSSISRSMSASDWRFRPYVWVDDITWNVVSKL